MTRAEVTPAPVLVRQAGEPRSARIESLRALAALGVLVSHVYGWAHLFHPEIYRRYAGRALLGGGFGVSLFFTLSGYLIFLPFARAGWGDAQPADLRHYLRNRALRVLPLYYVVAAFFLLVQGSGYRHVWWRFALLLESFWPSSVAQLDGPVWSLVVEVQFYVLLPPLALLLARTCRSLRGAAAVLLLVGAAAAVLRLLTVSLGHPSPVWQYSLPAWGVFFFPGLLLALARVQCDRHRPRCITTGPLSSALPWALLCVGTLLAVFYDYRLDMLLLVGWFVLVGACVLPLGSDRGVRWLDVRPLSAIGIASYSLYLWHFPLVRDLRMVPWLPHDTLGLGLVAVPVSVAVALVSYRVIEEPVLRLRRR